MFDNMRDWVGFAMTAVSLLLAISAQPRRRVRRIERFRSLKVWGLEWTARDREDDSQSQA